MQKELLVCYDLIIPIKHVIYIEKNEKNNDQYDIKVCGNDGKFLEWVTISKVGFNQIKEQLTSEKEIKKLEAKIKELELHISLTPGGSEYLKTQQHYNNLEKNELGKE